MIKETRKERIERQHREMLGKLLPHFIEGAKTLPHNQNKGN